MIKYLIVAMSVFIFIGCAGNTTQISKVYGIDYPDGISVTLYDKVLRGNIEIVNARLVNKTYKKQVQFTINNSSDTDFNIKVSHEWTNDRGAIQNNPKLNNLRLRANSAKKMILNAPNFKAKNVLINIDCGKN